MAISTTGYSFLVQRMRHFTDDTFNGNDAFMTGLVCKTRNTRHVTNGIDTIDTGLLVFINADKASIHLHANRFKPQVFNVS